MGPLGYGHSSAQLPWHRPWPWPGLVALAARVFIWLQPGWASCLVGPVCSQFRSGRDGAGGWDSGIFGVDGKMATYAALVVAIAACQWLWSPCSWQG